MDRVAQKVADYIKAQLGRQACIMLGAADYVVVMNGLQFNIRNNPHDVVRIIIYLELNDTYTLEFYGPKDPMTWEMALKARACGIREQELHKIIEIRTGLTTKLKAM